MAPAIEVASLEQLQGLAAKHRHLLVYFWARWAEPCQHLDPVIDELLAMHGHLACAKVEAEEVPDVSRHLEVAAVPSFVMLRCGDVADRLEGYDPAALAEKAGAFLSGGPIAADMAAAGDQPSSSGLEALVRQQPVMLFMKGSPDVPRCGFSKKVVQALREAGVAFGHFDILSDEQVRQGLKEFSNWPTYPQLYAGGELLGGCDIVIEMAAAGELEGAVKEALADVRTSRPQAEIVNVMIAPEGGRADDTAKARTAKLRALVRQQPVMLFMKGSPDAPRCGFSKKVVEALRQAGVAFGHFDILTDDEVRQGLKDLSDWPTYPQLYAGGELLGGCDIVIEMAAAGELTAAVDEALTGVRSVTSSSV